MLEFKNITLNSKDIINKYFKKEYVTSSEYSFTTLLIWGEMLSIKYAEICDCLVLYFKHNNNPASLRFPIGNGNKEEALIKAFEYMAEKGEQPRIYGMTLDQVEKLKNFSNENYENFENFENFEIFETKDYYDYVYESEKLINLSGKKLHSKKNHYNSFVNSYDYKFNIATEDDAEKILNAYDNFSNIGDDESLIFERKGMEFVLKNLSKLDVVCGYLTVNDDVCAFTIGEELNENTAVIHIEKANTNYKGSYAAINKLFVENCFSNYKYINREEDCGVEGLKKAKQSYQPEFMIKKYSVYF